MQRFTDLCTYLGCKPYLKDSGYQTDMSKVTLESVDEMLGHCGRVISGDSRTVFYDGNYDQEELQKRIDEIQEGIRTNQETEDALERDSRVNSLRLRVNMLSG